jgi:Winged helix DNA-binding domain
MTTKDLLRTRLYLQRLNRPDFRTPAEMVKHFGAVQAQDYLGALWAVGQRVENCTEAIVEQALADRSIVRSWPMRGTLHFVLPEDLRWMLDLLAPRIIHKSKSIIRAAGLTSKHFSKGRTVLEKILAGGKVLDRDEIYTEFKKGKLDTADSRGLHILGHLAMEKVICFGPRRGKQQTFVLLDEWIPPEKSLTKEESMGAIALRYYHGHGPASIHDLAWWTGLTITEATAATDMVIGQLEKITFGDRTMFMQPGLIDIPTKPVVARLLPAYDEFLISYQDRSASETEAIRKLKDLNAIFTSTLILNGSIVGTWKRMITNKGVKIEIKKLEKLTKVADDVIKKECSRYASFIGSKLIK